VLNEIIWFSVRGAGSRMPEVARLPAFDAMREGILEMDDDGETPRRMKKTLAKR
jgi:hypothetical protein